MPVNFIGKRSGGRHVAVTAMAGMLSLVLLIATTAGCVSLLLAMAISPETRGKELVADLVVA